MTYDIPYYGRCPECGQLRALPKRYRRRTPTLTRKTMRQLVLGYMRYLKIDRRLHLRYVMSESSWAATSTNKTDTFLNMDVDCRLLFKSLRYVHKVIGHEMSEYMHRGGPLQDKIEAMHFRNGRILVRAAHTADVFPDDLRCQRRIS